MIGFGKIGQNGRCWAKMAKFWSKKGKKVKFQIFPEENFFAIFLKTKKLVYMAKISKILWLDLEKIGQNGRFWIKMAIFGPFLAQNGENEIFSPKNETVTFLRNWWRTYERTYGRAWIHRSPSILETKNVTQPFSGAVEVV